MTSRTASLLGVFAILFWSTNIALSRSLAEQVGTMTSAGWLMVCGGVISGLIMFRKAENRAALRALPFSYLAGCGVLFVGNIVFFYLALGLAANRQQLVEVGILNYFWVPLTLLFSVPLLGKRARWMVLPGIVLSLSGVFLTVAQTGSFSWEGFAANLRHHGWPYVFALCTALCWSLYSNLSRRWVGERAGGAVPLFLLASGLAMFALRVFFPEQSAWTPRMAPEFAFLVVFPIIMAYNFWETAMRRGNLVLVASLSYFIPLLSTLITGLYLHVSLGPGILAGCGLVVAGAVLCKWGIE
jgi:drug/metabolite transporter (DMT)-like permease